jgi:UDP-glucose 4-epimerase
LDKIVDGLAIRHFKQINLSVNMKILVTGGAGYIGTHTLIELVSAGFSPIVLDNFSNSSDISIKRVEEILGTSIPVYRGDVRDTDTLRKVFETEKSIVGAIHFAGLKAVGESVALPLFYYDVNVGGSIKLAEVMDEFGVHNLLFSSSATVYGDPETVPITEDFPTAPESPYGRSKLIVEEIYRDVCVRPNNSFKMGLLRYFNPIGAHESGKIGEDPSGVPNNLLPYVAQVAIGKLPELNVFGDDYPTPDGTGVRDYIHVVDLAKGHVKAMQYLVASDPGCKTWNLGTGKGSSVLDVVKRFEQASGRQIPLKVTPRRAGDVAEYYADPTLAANELNWQAEFDLQRMVEDTWRWQSNNPKGYAEN